MLLKKSTRSFFSNGREDGIIEHISAADILLGEGLLNCTPVASDAGGGCASYLPLSG